jgi:hypothetical protein
MGKCVQKETKSHAGKTGPPWSFYIVLMILLGLSLALRWNKDQGDLERGKLGRMISLAATTRYATSTQDGIGLAAWSILMFFVIIHVFFFYLGWISAVRR